MWPGPRPTTIASGIHNELLFLSLTVEALQGKICQNSLPSGGGGSVTAKISDGRDHPSANTTRKAIDCATTLALTVFI